MITTTMKKEYIAPEAMAYDLRMHTPLLAGSVVDLVIPDDPQPPINNEFNGREFDFEEEEFYEEF